MQHLDQLIEMALAEDIGPGDITTAAIAPGSVAGRGRIIAKEPVVLAGSFAAARVFSRLDCRTTFETDFSDGDMLSSGETVATVRGDITSLLMGERTALNFLQHLSGIASHTRAFVEALSGSRIRLVDTRKTTPGWRALEKFAVRKGGGYNHRMGLYDGILIKDNHIAAHGSITAAVAAVRERAPHLLGIEVETACLDEVREALAAGVEVIMLDNMPDAEIKKAVSEINGRALVEVSGQVRKEDLRRLSGLGVDIVSSGALIHGARFMDISMEIDALPR
jgi:nicotinate-nucleotide pyrophosphorylase (carboxylating)